VFASIQTQGCICLDPSANWFQLVDRFDKSRYIALAMHLVINIIFRYKAKITYISKFVKTTYNLKTEEVGS